MEGSRTLPEPELIGRIPAVVYVAEPGERGRWHYVSPQIEKLLGYTPEEWQADPGLWATRLHPDDRARVLEEEAQDNGAGAPAGSEYRMVARDGHVIWVRDEAVVRQAPDGTRRYDGLLIDITERKQFEARLHFLGEPDPLTGVRNRWEFLVELEAEIKLVRRYHEPASILMVDIDDLKTVNDALGHGTGDELLRAVGASLVRRLRDSDTVARLGDDEFAALLRGAQGAQALAVAEELTRTIRSLAPSLAPTVAGAGVSIGVAEIRRRFRTAEDVLSEAHRAMDEARGGEAGRRRSNPADRALQPDPQRVPRSASQFARSCRGCRKAAYEVSADPEVATECLPDYGGGRFVVALSPGGKGLAKLGFKAHRLHAGWSRSE